jgi:hypothetical protein
MARVLGRLRSAFDAVRPLPEEVTASRPGDDLIPEPQLVMDRAFTLEGPLEAVWPWLVQLGKNRSGWYLPRGIERLIPRRRRALRAVDPKLAHLAVGDVIPDWGGRSATFEVAELRAPVTLVYRSRRRQTNLSWAINLESGGDAGTPTAANDSRETAMAGQERWGAGGPQHRCGPGRRLARAARHRDPRLSSTRRQPP